MNGREVTFNVSASDVVGEIGTGMHTRLIVDMDKFMSKAAGRIK